MSIYFWLVLQITIISLVGIGQSLNFSLNGDDWLALWRYIKDFTSFQSHFDTKNYSTNYGNYVFANIIMGIIYKTFSFNPLPYYSISIILRIMAAISFYPAIRAVAKDKLAAILSSIFFASMFAGIETTNWVFNMNTYISIALFNLFVYLYYSKQFPILSGRSILAALTLGLSFIVTQNRMHGLLFIIPLLVFSKISKINIQNLKGALFRIIILFFPILGYRLLTRSSNDIVYIDFFTQSVRLWKNLLLGIFSSVGNAIFPEKIYAFFNIKNELKALIVFLIFLNFFILYIKKRNLSHKYFFLLVSLSISIFFLIIPLVLFSPSETLSSDHRYQTIPGSYLLVAFAIILSDLLRQNNQIYKILAVSLIAIIISANLIGLRYYFNMLSDNGRLINDANKQFKFISSQIEKTKNNAPLVFLFIPDNPIYLYNAITFGFPYHMMLTDDRFSLDIQTAPFPVDNLDSLIDVLGSKESKELKRYGYSPIEIPLENVYAFSLQNKNLTNITAAIRNYLKEKLPNVK